MGELLDLEAVAESTYAAVGLDPERPHVTRLARAMLGPSAIERGPRPFRSPAALVRASGAWRIVVARSLPPLAALFAVAHELGHWLLAREGYCDPTGEESAADYLGAALIAPRPAFLAARRAVGDELAELARALHLTETAAALRRGEVLGVPIAVVAPSRIRVRSHRCWSWPDEPTLRGWAREPVPGVRKARLRDDPRRVVLEVSDLG